jgi:hypothetical protein
MKTSLLLITGLLSALLPSCSGCGRQWSNFTASAYGSDWVVVQYSARGTPINCWKLRDVSVDNEGASDGIQWKISGVGMMHLSGWYVRVMVDGGDYESSLKYLGLDVASCPGGRYISKDIQIGEVVVESK